MKKCGDVEQISVVARSIKLNKKVVWVFIAVLLSVTTMAKTGVWAARGGSPASTSNISTDKSKLKKAKKSLHKQSKKQLQDSVRKEIQEFSNARRAFYEGLDNVNVPNNTMNESYTHDNAYRLDPYCDCIRDCSQATLVFLDAVVVIGYRELWGAKKGGWDTMIFNRLSSHKNEQITIDGKKHKIGSIEYLENLMEVLKEQTPKLENAVVSLRGKNEQVIKAQHIYEESSEIQDGSSSSSISSSNLK